MISTVEVEGKIVIGDSSLHHSDPEVRRRGLGAVHIGHIPRMTKKKSEVVIHMGALSLRQLAADMATGNEIDRYNEAYVIRMLETQLSIHHSTIRGHAAAYLHKNHGVSAGKTGEFFRLLASERYAEAAKILGPEEIRRASCEDIIGYGNAHLMRLAHGAAFTQELRYHINRMLDTQVSGTSRGLARRMLEDCGLCERRTALFFKLIEAGLSGQDKYYYVAARLVGNVPNSS